MKRMKNIPKKLEEEIDKSNIKWKKALDTENGFSKKLTIESNKTHKFTAVAKYLIF